MFVFYFLLPHLDSTKIEICENKHMNLSRCLLFSLFVFEMTDVLMNMDTRYGRETGI